MIIHFYEKPGCINNTKQKRILEAHGHKIYAHSLLSQSWKPSTLRLFFADMPVPKWFNMAAPRIKSGEIVPESFEEDAALLAMINDPLLIRRPLIDAQGELGCGFDNYLVKKLLGVDANISDLQTCPNIGKHQQCD
ncbi:MAG: ArsC/Spx/MgsR family protein [Paludibacter sp.]